MNLTKRFFLITAAAVLIVGAIALGPVSKRVVNPVHAAPPTPAVAIITCTAVNGSGGVLGQPVVNNVDFSLGLVIPPAQFANVQTGVNCAVALQTLLELGFQRQDSSAAVYAGSAGLNNTTGGVIFTWTYTLPNEAPLL